MEHTGIYNQRNVLFTRLSFLIITKDKKIESFTNSKMDIIMPVRKNKHPKKKKEKKNNNPMAGVKILRNSQLLPVILLNHR